MSYYEILPGLTRDVIHQPLYMTRVHRQLNRLGKRSEDLPFGNKFADPHFQKEKI